MWRSCLILKGPQKEFESNAGCEGQLLESYLNICGILFWLWNRLKWSLFLLLLPCLKDTLKGKSSSMYIVQSQVLSSFSNCLSNIQRKLKNEKIMPYLLSDWKITYLSFNAQNISDKNLTPEVSYDVKKRTYKKRGKTDLEGRLWNLGDFKTTDNQPAWKICRHQICD